MLCVRALVRVLNDAKNRAQQGCAMQFSGITLTTMTIVFFPFCSALSQCGNVDVQMISGSTVQVYLLIIIIALKFIKPTFLN